MPIEGFRELLEITTDELITSEELMTAAAIDGEIITHELATSGDFYKARGASAIMRAAHFPDDLLSFLQLESLTILQSVRDFLCDSLVELGCYDGRAIEVARLAGIRYLGVDINDNAVRLLKRKIISEGLQRKANAVVADITVPDQWCCEVSGKTPLYVFPFNLVGNLPNPRALFETLNSTNGFGIISVFNSDVWTTKIRRDYYTACGIVLSGIEPAPYGGVRFRSSTGFTSQSFSSDCFDRFLEDSGVEPVRSTHNRFGRCATVQFGRHTRSDSPE